MQDSFPFSIGLSSDEGAICTLSNGVLFPKGHPFPSVKMLTLHRSCTFDIEAFYANQNELPPGVSPKISNFTVRIHKIKFCVVVVCSLLKVLSFSMHDKFYYDNWIKRYNLQQSDWTRLNLVVRS